MFSPMYMAALPFVSPWLFGAGAAATAIPIIIHLLNRRRFRVRTWAAMDFLLAAYRRNIRRLQFQRWLLLLLRCLAILLLAVAMAQFIPPSRAITALLGGPQKLTVLIWNDAYPMAYHPAHTPSLFAQSRHLIDRWLDTAGGNQRVAILRGSIYTQPLVDQPTGDLVAAEKLVRRQQVSQAVGNLAGGLQRALKLVSAAHGPVAHQAVWIVTACSAADFGVAAGASPAAHLRRLVRAIRKTGTQVKIIDVGDPNAANLAITMLQTVRPIVLTGQPLQLDCRVFNGSSSPQADVSVQFYLDHVPAGRHTIARLDPGQTITLQVPLDRTIQTPGWHAIEAHIPADGLTIDNVRRLAVRAVRHIKILLVDGESWRINPAHPLASTAWLQAALAPRTPGNIFQPVAINALQLADESLSHYRGVILSNTPAPDAALAARLRRYVHSGGLLMIFPGSGFNGDRWNQALGAGPDAMAPAAWGQVIHLAAIGQSGHAGIGFDLHGTANVITAPFIAAEQSGIHTGLGNVMIQRYVSLSLPKNAGPSNTQVLLRFTNGAPALVKHAVGRGTVIAWAITCDTRWSDFPAQPSWLPVLYELLYHSLANRNTPHNLLVGEFAPVTGVQEPVINPPSLDRAKQVAAPLWHTGFYDSTTSANTGGQSDPVAVADTRTLSAVNVDPADADIRHLPPARVAALLGLPVRDVVERPRTLAAFSRLTGTAGSGVFGHWMLWPALLVLLAEALLARAFSHYRHGTAPAPQT